MQRLLILLLFLVASVWVGLEVFHHPGYLLVVYKPWVVQMPIWFAMLSCVMAFGLFYVLIASIDQFHFWWFQLKNWLRIRREHKSYSKTQQGLAALIEWRWKKAERLLLAGVHQSIEPFINYLAAARAAQEQSAYERRDNYIKKAYQVAPNAEIAVGITQAELELEQGQFEHATATLGWLKQKSPRHPRILRLLEKAYVHLADWKELQALLPSMRKAKMLKRVDLEHLEKNITCEILRTSTSKSLNELQQIWGDMPRSMRKNPEVVCAYVKQLQRFSSTKEIEELIRKALRYDWCPELVNIYGTLPFSNLNRQLVIAGAWLKMYGQQPELLFLLGKLCMRIQLWGKAKDYFDRCLALGPNIQASLEYGRLLEQLGDNDAARLKYRDGLILLSSVISPPPSSLRNQR